MKMRNSGSRFQASAHNASCRHELHSNKHSLLAFTCCALSFRAQKGGSNAGTHDNTGDLNRKE